MNQDLQELIAALREELKQYGEMLNLLDQLDRAARGSAPQLSYHCTQVLQHQSELVAQARRLRESRRRALARELRQDEGITLFQLMPLLPPAYRPLLQSLVEENRDLFESVQRAARANHEFLTRSAQSMARSLDVLLPEDSAAA